MPARRPPHILLVDAQSDIRDLLLSAFLDHGFTFSFADDPFSGKLLLALLTVDLLVVDPLRLLDAGRDLVDHAAGLGIPVLALPGSFADLGAVVSASTPRQRRADRVVERVAVAVGPPQTRHVL